MNSICNLYKSDKGTKFMNQKLTFIRTIDSSFERNAASEWYTSPSRYWTIERRRSSSSSCILSMGTFCLICSSIDVLFTTQFMAILGRYLIFSFYSSKWRSFFVNLNEPLISCSCINKTARYCIHSLIYIWYSKLVFTETDHIKSVK